MKHLELYENYTEKNIKDMLLKSQRKSQIDIKAPIEDILKNIKNDISLIGTFEGFIEDEGSFISEGDKKRMGEYIKKMKDLGINTTKIEKLLPKYERYVYLSYETSDMREFDYKNPKYIKLLDEYDSLEPYAEKFENEIKILAKRTKRII